MDGKMTWDERVGLVPAYEDAVKPKDYPPYLDYPKERRRSIKRGDFVPAGTIILTSENPNNSGIPGTWKKINEVWEKQPEEG